VQALISGHMQRQIGTDRETDGRRRRLKLSSHFVGQGINTRHQRFMPSNQRSIA